MPPLYTKAMRDKLRCLDLFSGIGGMALGLRPVATTVAYCEIDKNCIKVLTRLMKDRRLERAPIMPDADALDVTLVRSLRPQLVTAGFPCQDISVTNRVSSRTVEGAKSKVVFKLFDLLRRVPSIKYVFLENSPNIVNAGLDTLTAEFTTIGWKLAWGVFSANEVGAHHLRRRWFCLAYKHGPPDVGMVHWSTPRIGPEPPRVVQVGYPDAVKRCSMLGNAVVPAAAMLAFRTLAQHASLSATPLKKLVYVVGADGATTTLYRDGTVKGPSDLGLVVVTNERRTYTLWSTPLHYVSKWYPTLVNRRNSVWMANQIINEAGTKRDIKQRLLRGRTPFNMYDFRVNPVFVEWLMMFPRDWTVM